MACQDAVHALARHAGDCCGCSNAAAALWEHFASEGCDPDHLTLGEFNRWTGAACVVWCAARICGLPIGCTGLRCPNQFASLPTARTRLVRAQQRRAEGDAAATCVPAISSSLQLTFARTPSCIMHVTYAQTLLQPSDGVAPVSCLAWAPNKWVCAVL
jgi:hypothetical protein